MSKKIAFVIGSAAISGGTYVIFQHAMYLKKQGHQVTMICMSYDEYKNLQQQQQPWHEGIHAFDFIAVEEAGSDHFDLVIFTWWKTIYHAPDVSGDNYLYFVQSIESRFYPVADKPLRRLVDKTYQISLPVITEATWIKNYLRDKYQRQVHLVPNGARKDCYFEKGPVFAPREVGKLRVLVEGPLNVSFKNVEKTIDLCSRVSDIEVWLLSSTLVKSYPGVNRVFSQVPVSETAKIYRSCDVIVKLSYVEGMFGPPLEMFHCGGTAIVYDVTGHDEYIKNEVNGLVIRTDNEKAVVAAIEKLRDQPVFLRKLKDGALKTAGEWFDWEMSSRQFDAAVSDFMTHGVTRVATKDLRDKTREYFSTYEQEVKASLNKFRLKAALKNCLRPLFIKYPKLNILRSYVSSLGFLFHRLTRCVKG